LTNKKDRRLEELIKVIGTFSAHIHSAWTEVYNSFRVTICMKVAWWILGFRQVMIMTVQWSSKWLYRTTNRVDILNQPFCIRLHITRVTHVYHEHYGFLETQFS